MLFLELSILSQSSGMSSNVGEASMVPTPCCWTLLMQDTNLFGMVGTTFSVRSVSRVPKT